MSGNSFAGKTVLITGAARGIGRALAEHMKARGCRVSLSDINEKQLKDTALAIGAEHRFVCDVASPADCEDYAREAARELGVINYLISNAGIVISGALDEIDPNVWKRVIEVNLCGFFNICRAAVPYMPAGGAVVQINSKSGKKGSFKNSAYAASKFGGVGLTQSLALELAERGIRVNAVCPGNLMNSPLWTESLHEQYAKNRGMTKQEVWDYYEKQAPLGRTCEYEDVAGMTEYLLSDKASYITGQAINITGGFEMR